jgi:hypothetical protein
VEVALDPPALRLRRLDEPRTRGLEIGQPGQQLGPQPLVLERERGGGADRVHQLGVVAQRRVVHERGDRLALALEERRHPGLPRAGQAHRRAARPT